jgi:DNA-binding NarL/FixJ family response regulator
VLVDSDERVRESLAGILSIGRQVEVVGTTGEPAAGIELVTSLHPNVCVVDPRLPDMDRGRAFIGRLRDVAPDVRILVMNVSDAPDDGLLGSTVDGFVRKTYRPSELLAAIMSTCVPAAR